MIYVGKGGPVEKYAAGWRKKKYGGGATKKIPLLPQDHKCISNYFPVCFGTGTSLIQSMTTAACVLGLFTCRCSKQYK